MVGSNRIYYYKLFLLEITSNKNVKNLMNPLISVIIPIYNGEKILMRSLLSIESQTFQVMKLYMLMIVSQIIQLN